MCSGADQLLSCIYHSEYKTTTTAYIKQQRARWSSKCFREKEKKEISVFSFDKKKKAFLPRSIYFQIFAMLVIWCWISRRLLWWKSRCILLKEASLNSHAWHFPSSFLWTLWCSQIDSRELPGEFRSPISAYSAHPHRHQLSNVCSAYITYPFPQIIHNLFSCNPNLYLL